MAPRVRYRNKVWLIAGLLLAAFCIYVFAQPKPPVLQVNSNDEGLRQKQDLLYYHGEPFTGTVTAFYDNGNTARQTPYYNGREEGVMRSWYPDKAPEQERPYTAGKKQGVHRGWWPGGQLKFEYHFVDDEYEGAAADWGANGKPYRLFHYNMGHEDGRQQMWWEDGSVRANYIVKDGQQYGLIGRKLCRNVFK